MENKVKTTKNKEKLYAESAGSFVANVPSNRENPFRNQFSSVYPVIVEKRIRRNALSVFCFTIHFNKDLGGILKVTFPSVT